MTVVALSACANVATTAVATKANNIIVALLVALIIVVVVVVVVVFKACYPKWAIRQEPVVGTEVLVVRYKPSVTFSHGEIPAEILKKQCAKCTLIFLVPEKRYFYPKSLFSIKQAPSST